MPTIIKTFTSSQGGVKNYLSTRSSSFSGWTNVGTGATGSTTTTAAELPELSVGTALKVTNGGSGSGYVESDFFQVDASDLGKLLGLTYNLETSTSPAYAASDLQIQVWDATTSGGTYAQNTTLNVANVPSSPTGGTMQLSFSQNPSRPFTRIRIVRVAGLANSWASFSSITVTSATGGQSAAISDPVSVTMTTNLTNNTVTATETRIGSWAFYNVLISFTGAPSAGNLALNLPSGRTINTAALLSTDATSGNNLPHSSGTYRDAGTISYPLTIAYNSTTSVVLFYTDDAAAGVVVQNNITATTPTTIANTDYIKMSFAVPIAEWAGSGTVNLGPGAQVTYIADDGSSDVFGPNGALVPSIAFGSGVTDRVITLSNKQSTLSYDLEINYRGFGWAKASDLFPYTTGNNASATNGYGIQAFHSSATEYTVRFGNRGTKVAASNVDNGSESWATENTNGTRFRLVVANPSSPVGYGKSNSNEFGLVAPRRGQQALTVTSTLPGWSTIRAVGVYYQDQDGNHRLKFNFTGSCAAGARTSGTWAITGVTWKNVANFLQCVSGFSNGGGAAVGAYTTPPNGNSINLEHLSSTTTLYCISGDVELESRPSWA